MSFDTLAPYYRWMERVLAGGQLQRCRTAFLDTIDPPQGILIPGPGRGRFLAVCRERFPSAQITIVDASRRMLELSQRHLENRGQPLDRVCFVHADILKWEPPAETFQLIATHFFLDCFTPDQVAGIVEKLARVADAEANWFLSDFQVPPNGLGRLRAKVILRLLYWFFRMTTRIPADRLVSPDPFLNRAGFKLRQRVVRDWGLLRSDWWRKGG